MKFDYEPEIYAKWGPRIIFPATGDANIKNDTNQGTISLNTKLSESQSHNASKNIIKTAKPASFQPQILINEKTVDIEEQKTPTGS